MAWIARVALGFALTILVSAAAPAATLDVPATYPNIQAAIDAAVDGDEVVIAPGTYTGPGNRDLDFGGREIKLRSVDPNDPAVVAATIIDCQGSKSDPHRGFDFHSEETNESIVAGLTITGGWTDYSGGGGIRIDEAEPVIAQCRIVGNRTEGRGGGVYSSWVSGVSAWLVNCTISDNHSDWEGGGLCAGYGLVLVFNCVISGNSSQMRGGGIATRGPGGAAFVWCSSIVGNLAEMRGGGLFMEHARPWLYSSILWSNTAPAGPQLAAEHADYVDLRYNILEGGQEALLFDSCYYLNLVGNIDGNPLFVDADGPDDDPLTYDDNDYRLSVGSPGIDQGEVTSWADDIADFDGDGRMLEFIPYDLLGNPRLANCTVDIGAHEFGGPAPQSTIMYVDASVTRGSSGRCWETAFKDLDSALEEAERPDSEVREIWVADGRYIPTRWWLFLVSGPDSRRATFPLRNGLAIYGGFAGGEANRDQRDPVVNVTILSGDRSGGRAYHVVTGTGTDATAILDGFTITDGAADYSGQAVTGGGFYNDGGSPTIRDCRFTQNFALKNGSAVHNLGGNPTFTDCEFVDNALGSYSLQDAGSFYNENGSPILTNCRFSLNTVRGFLNRGGSPVLNHCRFTDHPGGGMADYSGSSQLTACEFISNTATSGGGLYCAESSQPILIDCLFRQNTAQSGGGLYSDRSTLMLSDCRFEENQATGTGSMAGGVYCYYGTSTLTGCMFVANSGPGGGGLRIEAAPFSAVDCVFLQNLSSYAGGLCHYGGQGRVDRGVFLGNRATWHGGAIEARSSERLLLIDCLFSGNSSGQNGGAIASSSYQLAIFNSTFTNNLAISQGGGIYASSTWCVPRLTNCILWGNADAGGMDESAQIHGGAPIVNYSCVQGMTAGAWGGVGNVDADPRFIDADGLDGVPGTLDDDARLQRGSPCIDAGDNDVDTDPWQADVQPLPEMDLDGLARFADDPVTIDTGAGMPPIVDMGAYEYVLRAPADLDRDGDVDADDLDSFLACGSGPGVPQEAPDCLDADFDDDGDVDQRDFAIYQVCISGADMPADPMCGR